MNPALVSEIERIAESYRAHRAWDLKHAPSAQSKKQIGAVRSAATKLLDSITHLDDRARRQFALRIGAALDADGNVALLEAARMVGAMVDAAELAKRDIPKNSRKTAARMAASSLYGLFKHHGMAFTATADEYEAISPAVEAMLAVARAGDDSKMTPAVARKWIEGAITEHREHKGVAQEEATRLYRESQDNEREIADRK